MTKGQWKRKVRMQGYNLDNLEVMMKEKLMDCNKKRKRNETEPDQDLMTTISIGKKRKANLTETELCLSEVEETSREWSQTYK